MLGDVDNSHQNSLTPWSVNRVETDLDRKFATVFPKAVQFSTAPHPSFIRTGKETFLLARLFATKPFWYQKLNRLPHQLVTAVTEQLLDMSIHQRDVSFLVDN